MKQNKKKNKAVKDAHQPLVLIGATYRRAGHPLPVFAVKLLLTYMLAVGTVTCFMNMYSIPMDPGFVILQAVLFVTAFLPIFIFVKKRYALPVFAAVAGVIYFFAHEQINEALNLFKDYVFIQLESRLLSTLQYVPINSHAFLTRTQDFTSGMNTAMLVLSCIICLICVLCCYKKFRPIPLIMTWSVLFIPAFLSEDADYSPYFLLVITAFFGLYAISSANGFYSQIPVADGKSDIKNEEKAFKNNLRKKNPIQVAGSQLSHYGKNCLCGILAAAIVFGSAFGVQNMFPGMQYISTDEIINNTVKFFTDIGDYINMAFSGNLGGMFNGYFSSDNFFINNNIELNSPAQSSSDPVLKVTSSSKSSMYLVGDIGVDFTGRSWVSVQKKNNANELYSGDYDISDSFSPEQIAQITQYLCMFGLYSYDTSGLSYDDENYLRSHFHYPGYTDVSDVMTEITNLGYYNEYYAPALYDSASVRVDYLKNTNIVFKPFMPDNNAYMSNDNFKYYGDTVIRVADRKNWIQSFESNVLIPKGTAVFGFVRDNSSENKKIEILQSLGYTYQEARRYFEDKKEYDNYVYDTYLTVPESEKANIDRFIELFESAEGDYAGKVTDSFVYTYGMCEYLRTHYEYSLTADNTSAGNNTMLGNFLFETKQGHCALYASAMTLALREKGVPARYITGFTTGELDYNSDSGMYEKTINADSLHAWVEVYDNDFGWIPFDPTGFGGNNGSSGNAQQTTVTTTPPPSTTPTSTTTTDTHTTTPKPETDETTKPVTKVESGFESNGSEGSDESADITVLIIVLLAVAATALILASLFAFVSSVKQKNEKRKKRFRKSADTVGAVKEMYGFIMKLFEATDIKPEGTELPEEFAIRADELLQPLGMEIRLENVMRIIEKAEFSNDVISEDERRQVYEFTYKLYELILSNAGKVKQIWLKVTL